jgi:hypothetical protein
MLQLLVSVFQISNEFGDSRALLSVHACSIVGQLALLIFFDCEQKMFERHFSSRDWSFRNATSRTNDTEFILYDTA